MKTKIVALFCACFILLNVVDMVIPRSESKIYDSVIRLHILAEDNSESAQTVKLMVRDAILDECGDLFAEDGNIVSASETVESNLPKIEEIANRVLSENGMNYKAVCEWGTEEYPTRVYENLTLPSGIYRSLRINLGKAEGNNWWCVLFPPLCTKASAGESDFTRTDVNKNDSKVFTNRKYTFRFKLLEFFW
ncbi:MAG: stage II sporulation protein R [Clostridia bacterium]|nr:stage II sporulation protein R [Clostridia bacterium]